MTTIWRKILNFSFADLYVSTISFIFDRGKFFFIIIVVDADWKISYKLMNKLCLTLSLYTHIQHLQPLVLPYFLSNGEQCVFVFYENILTLCKIPLYYVRLVCWCKCNRKSVLLHYVSLRRNKPHHLPFVKRVKFLL